MGLALAHQSTKSAQITIKLISISKLPSAIKPDIYTGENYENLSKCEEKSIYNPTAKIKFQKLQVLHFSVVHFISFEFTFSLAPILWQIVWINLCEIWRRIFFISKILTFESEFLTNINVSISRRLAPLQLSALARPGHDTIWSCYKLAAQLISLPTPGPWSRRENNYFEVKIF